ncbi:nucleoporin-related [Striga asiatica]|uniref:Nucleoporin-related n=1 Tax=Striga asiatica TaxID=4170 RepID=A0A5A7QSJ6_STRAF|nr:nucleoporin-related [Striga asiatica]
MKVSNANLRKTNQVPLLSVAFFSLLRFDKFASVCLFFVVLIYQGWFMQSSVPRSTEEKGGILCDDDFCRIEELIKANTFSREEICHLVEILESRVDNQLEKPKLSIDAGVDTKFITHGLRTTPSTEKQPDIDRNAIGTSREKVPVGVSASPIDIARAYMASRSSGGSRDFNIMNSNCEMAELGNEFARKPFLPPPSPKPAICWPGATVHEHHGYTTPHSQMGRHRLHNYPRTPYSRIILPKSNKKLQFESADANMSTPFKRSQSSIHRQANSSRETFDRYGSVGPIRHIKNRFSSEVRPRGSIFNPPKDNPTQVVKPAFGGFIRNTEKTQGIGETSVASKYCSGNNTSVSSDRDISNQNSAYSDSVRKILEHLDRNKPTPKEKEAELRLATAWRKSPPEATDISHDEKIRSAHAEELAAHNKSADGSCADVSVGFNKNSSKSSFNENSRKSSLFVNSVDKGLGEVEGAVTETVKSPGSGFTCNAFATNNHGQTEKSLLFPHPHLSNGQEAKIAAGTTDSHMLKNDGKRPSLPSISIGKPVFSATSSENVPGFTFPVSTCSGVLSEPPTPSVMPSAVSHSIDLHTIPSYTFGVKKSTPPLVFSFPSTSSSTSSLGEDYDLKFSFGSEHKTRLSFSSVGKDAICY